ncbi:SAG-related sequence [Besnoitia besnoiti]|uniref:SAG-related sequence n=1 Tax=Besnoitia besnoiti TaxID=94643 RepID=A0A2A9MFZ1_BESBE|nr:SAG-related sequence [Besnoitia besnoiti]PFH36104.1 SAG-related sequence [Besnoitia besnoiti]
MGSPSARFGQALPAFVGARHQRRQTDYGFSPRKGLTLAVLVANFTAFSTYLCASGLPGRVSEETSSCEPTDNGTKCTCHASDTSSEAKSLTAALSQKKNLLEVVCKSPLAPAPAALAGALVCAAGADCLTECTAVKSPSCIDVVSLLSGTRENVKWKSNPEEVRDVEQSKTLTIPFENFPYTDGHFFVGCTDKNTTTKCTVAVTVEARVSTTAGQIVTCAYGAGSNLSHQAVTLSQSQNSFTLVCGEEGEVLPTKYETAYCSADAGADCSEDYKSVIPAYERSWWAKNNDGRSFTLSVPVDKFPTDQTKIVVGCRYKGDSKGSKNSDKDASGPTVCSVDVTIEASASAAMTVRSIDAFTLLVVVGILTSFARVM